jgi:hypothetical protein
MPRRGLTVSALIGQQIPLSIYLEMVVIRVYLKAQQEDDERIYHLCRKYSADELVEQQNSPFILEMKAKLLRLQTIPEKAFKRLRQLFEMSMSGIPTHSCTDDDILRHIFPLESPLVEIVYGDGSRAHTISGLSESSTPAAEAATDTATQQATLQASKSHEASKGVHEASKGAPASKGDGLRRSARLKHELPIHNTAEIERLQELNERKKVHWNPSQTKGWVNSQTDSEYSEGSGPSDSESSTGTRTPPRKKSRAK